jgi:hypothetical protein
MLSLIGVLLCFIIVSTLGKSLAAGPWGDRIPVVPDPEFEAGKLCANGEHRAQCVKTHIPADS